MRCWYAWLLSRESHIKGVDTVNVGIEKEEKWLVDWHLYPYPVKCKAFSSKAIKLRIKTIDKIITQCVTL